MRHSGGSPNSWVTTAMTQCALCCARGLVSWEVDLQSNVERKRAAGIGAFAVVAFVIENSLKTDAIIDKVR